MDSFGGDRNTSRDEKIVKHSMGRGIRAWNSQDFSRELRRPHRASSTSQSTIS